MVKLTDSELKILRAIDSAPGKVLGWSEAIDAADLTIRGGRTVLNRLYDARYITRSEMPETYRYPTITFKGQLAARAEG